MIIKIGSKTCGPCLRAEQLLNQLNIENESYDVHDDEDVISKYNIRNVPVILKIDADGNETTRLVGGQCIDKEQLEQL